MKAQRKKICIMLTDAGGGHRATAHAVADVLQEQREPFEVKLVNVYKEIFHSLDLAKMLFKISGEEIYNKILQLNATGVCWPLLAPLMKGNIQLHHRRGINLIAEFCKREQPDLMLSVMPFINRQLFCGLKQYHLNVPFVTLITDLDQCVDHQWIESDLEQHCICGTNKLYHQMRSLGHDPHKIHQTSGMVIHKKFYASLACNVAEERKKIGLHPDYKTALVMFGGYGSKVMINIAKDMNQLKDESFQAIFICGRNEELRNRLSGMQTSYPKTVLGFTQNVPFYMHLADFLIGKPGPGSISEALIKQLPVIIESNRFTMKQERFTQEWIETQGVGIAVKSFKHINQALHKMLHHETFAQYKTAVAKTNNHAVFEVAAILHQLMPR